MNEDIQRTEIICLLDRSGSMGGLEQDTIGGYNSLISRHGALEGEARITTVLFDDRYEVIHDHQSCTEALLSDADYFVRGLPHSMMLQAERSVIRRDVWQQKDPRGLR